jgi:hypothetical protein
MTAILALFRRISVFDLSGGLELVEEVVEFRIAMLLDEAGQFLAQLAEDSDVAARANALIGVVLARMIVEFYGGTLGVAGPEAPGFVIRLPAAG